MCTHERRRVRRDTTVSVDGTDWQLDQGFLAGRVVTVLRSLLDPTDPPWVEHEDKRLPLHRVDPVANGRRPRPADPPTDTTATKRIAFDPPKELLDRALGRTHTEEST